MQLLKTKSTENISEAATEKFKKKKPYRGITAQMTDFILRNYEVQKEAALLFNHQVLFDSVTP